VDVEIVVHIPINAFHLNRSIITMIKSSKIQAKEEYESLIDNKESFVVYIYSPGCYACGLFKPVIEGFVEEEKITIYQIDAYYLSETSLVEHVQYTPSVALFNQGVFIVSSIQ
jgi:thioredoxin-related protein